MDVPLREGVPVRVPISLLIARKGATYLASFVHLEDSFFCLSFLLGLGVGVGEGFASLIESSVLSKSGNGLLSLLA